MFPLDADDAVLPGALAALVDALDSRHDAAAVWGSVRVFGDVERQEHARARTLDPWRITYFNNLPYASLFRRDALLAVGGWSLPGPFQDWDLWMALAEAGFEGAGARSSRYCATDGTAGASSRAARSATQSSTRALKRRHERLFAARASNWRRSSDPWRVRLGLPLATAIPGLPQRHRHRLFTLADAPREALDLAAGGACARGLADEPRRQLRAEARTPTGPPWCACAARS